MKTAYAAAFDDFVRTRQIDENDDYWSDEDRAAWQQVLDRLRRTGVLPPQPSKEEASV